MISTETVNKVAPIEVRLRGVTKSFQGERGRVEALREVDLDVPAGWFVSILGPSGSGKSTLLGILAGLDEPDEGSIEYRVGTIDEGRRTEAAEYAIRNTQYAIRNTRLGQVGYMPQRDLLLPWLTALDNATVALEVAGVSRAEARARALPLFEEFGLGGFAGHYPRELSGGMRQRVSFLRSAILSRGLMLLDEPFGSLDALTRADMQEWLMQSAARLGGTFILVTHDVDEAVLLSDRVYVLSPRPGRIVGMVDVKDVKDEGRAEYRRRLLAMLRDE